MSRRPRRTSGALTCCVALAAALWAVRAEATSCRIVRLPPGQRRSPLDAPADRCFRGHPLAAEFKAVEAEYSVCRDPSSEATLERFVAKRGAAAQSLFELVIDRCVGRPVGDSTPTWWALRHALIGLDLLRAPGSARVLRKAVKNPNVPESLRTEALIVLARLPGADRTRVLGEALVGEESLLVRWSLMSELRTSVTAAAAPYLERALEEERNPSLAKELRSSLLEIWNPECCVLDDQTLDRLSDRTTLVKCYYRCPKSGIESLMPRLLEAGCEELVDPDVFRRNAAASRRTKD